MTTFERLIADVATEAAGPSRPVNATEIMRAATTTTPRWRFQSMFSATKFVVAGVIVALFGGLMLSGVLTRQPSDDSAPVVGASTSALPSPAIESAIAVDPITEPSGFVTTVIDVATMEPKWLVSTSDAVWALSGRSAARIDLVTHEVDVLKLPVRVLNQQIVDGSLWGTNTKNKKLRLVEIDLATGELLNTYPMVPPDRHWGWSAVIAGDLWFWGVDDQLARFDLAAREFTFERAARRFAPGENRGPCCLATDDAIWITKPGDYGFPSLRRFDVGTLEFTDTLPIDVQLPGMTAEGGIWVWRWDSEDEPQEILRVDQSSHEITDVIVVPWGLASYSNRLALSDTGIWAARENDGSVSRIDVASGDITHTIDVGGSTGTALAIDDAIWVPDPEARRVVVITPEAAAATE